jgi:hypothetical protein
MMLLEASITAREADTEQAASRTEAKAVETRTGPWRETDTTRAIATQTYNVTKTDTESTHYLSGRACHSIMSLGGTRRF